MPHVTKLFLSTQFGKAYCVDHVPPFGEYTVLSDENASTRISWECNVCHATLWINALVDIMPKMEKLGFKIELAHEDYSAEGSTVHTVSHPVIYEAVNKTGEYGALLAAEIPCYIFQDKFYLLLANIEIPLPMQDGWQAELISHLTQLYTGTHHYA